MTKITIGRFPLCSAAVVVLTVNIVIGQYQYNNQLYQGQQIAPYQGQPVVPYQGQMIGQQPFQYFGQQGPYSGQQPYQGQPYQGQYNGQPYQGQVQPQQQSPYYAPQDPNQQINSGQATNIAPETIMQPAPAPISSGASAPNPPETPIANPPAQNLSVASAQNPTAPPAQNPPVAPPQNPPATPAQNPPATPAQNPPPAPAQNPPAPPAQNPPAPPAQNPPVAPDQNPPATPAQNPPAPLAQNPPTAPSSNSDPNSDPTLCHLCKCPGDHEANPYVINCEKLNIDTIPSWDSFLKDIATNGSVAINFNYTSITTISEMPFANFLYSMNFDWSMVNNIKPFAFSDLPHLKHLILSHNNLSSIDSKAFNSKDSDHFVPLEILDLSFNSLSHLDKDLFTNLPNLEILNLQGNPFRVLDSQTEAALNSLHALTTLNLAETQINDLSVKLINPVRKLLELDISGNQIKLVPEVMQYGMHLKTLQLSGNPIEELTAASFVGLENLETLNVSNMPSLIRIDEGAFYPTMNLRFLYCNYNLKLSMIEVDAFRDVANAGPKHFERIEIRNSNLSFVSQKVFNDDIVVDVLDMRYNTFYCHCELYWLQLHTTEEFLEEITCGSPAAVANKTFAEVNLSSNNGDVPCSPMSVTAIREMSSNSAYIVLTLLLIIAIVAIIVVALMIVRSKPQLRYRIVSTFSSSSSSTVKYQRPSDNEAFNMDLNEDEYTDRCVYSRTTSHSS